MYSYTCTVTVRFEDDDVIEWLIDNDVIDEDEADVYVLTQEQIRDYAWELIKKK